MKKVILAALFAGVPASSLLAQGACPTPAGLISTYDAVPIAAGFATIAGTPGATLLAVPAACGDDSTSASVPLPFPFPFFGLVKTNCFVSANGHARFQATAPAAIASARNQHPGDPATPNEVASPWWDDLEFTNGFALPAEVWTRPDPGVFTIEWSNVSMKCATLCIGDGGRLSFQLKLFATGVIEFHYDPTSMLLGCAPCMPVPTTGIHGFNWAPSATVGLEGAVSAGAVVGVDPTGRGSGNDVWPRNNWRFTPVANVVDTIVTYTVTTGAAPFASIVGLPGTTTVAQNCLQIACPDDDDSARQSGSLIPIPFKFDLYGRSTKNANMNPNGFVSLGPGWFHKFWSFTGTAPQCTPNANYPNLALYPFHGDLEHDGLGLPDGMHYRVDGAPGCRVMTFEWSHLHPFSAVCPGLSPTDVISFQAKIHEGGVAGTLGRVQFLYDTANFSGAFTGTAAAAALIKAHNAVQFDGPGVLGCPLSGPPAASVNFDPCLTGTVHYYGDGTAGPGGFVPEIGTNGIRPAAGNPFGFHLRNAAPGAPVFLVLDPGGALPGFSLPVPCGGLPLPGCSLYVSLGAPIIFPPGVTTAGSAGQGVFTVPVPIPPGTPSGAVVYAQFALVTPGFGCLGVFSLSEGAIVVTG